MRRLGTLVTGALLGFALSACSPTPLPDEPKQHFSENSAEEQTETKEPEPVDEPFPTIALGEKVLLNEAELTVDNFKRVENFETECGELYVAPDDQSLYAIHITVTNTSNDIQYPDGQFIGEAMVTFRDSDGREMQFAFPECKLQGEETFDGLMSDKTKSRPLLVEGADTQSELGWIELSPSYDSDPIVVLLDETLDLALTQN